MINLLFNSLNALPKRVQVKLDQEITLYGFGKRKEREKLKTNATGDCFLCGMFLLLLNPILPPDELYSTHF